MANGKSHFFEIYQCDDSASTGVENGMEYVVYENRQQGKMVAVVSADRDTANDSLRPQTACPAEYVRVEFLC